MKPENPNEEPNRNMLLDLQYNFINTMVENLDLPVMKFSYPGFIIKKLNQQGVKYISRYMPALSPTEDLIGLSMLNLIPDDNRQEFLNLINQTIENKIISFTKHNKIVVDGEDVYIKNFYQPIYDINYKVDEIMLIGIDITSEMRAKEEAEKNRKMQEEFFINISHELKTPLNLIFSVVQMLEYHKDKCEYISNYIPIMKQNCYRLIRIVNNIVDLSKIDSGQLKLNLEKVNITKFVEEIVQSVADYVQGKGLKITFDTNVEDKLISIDRDKMERILLNLISNAIKFSDKGKEIMVCVTDKGETVEISVKDNGIGIDSNLSETIFNRFIQANRTLSRNSEGSGLGLNIVKSLVELHHGKISVESKLNQGSIFTVELPSMIIDNQESFISNNNDRVEKLQIEFSDVY